MGLYMMLPLRCWLDENESLIPITPFYTDAMDETTATRLRGEFQDHFDVPDGFTEDSGFPEPCPANEDEDWTIAQYDDGESTIVTVFALAGSEAVQPFYETVEDMWWGEPGHPEQVAVDIPDQI